VVEAEVLVGAYFLAPFLESGPLYRSRQAHTLFVGLVLYLRAVKRITYRLYF
jgi:hypothetical protein